MLPSGKPTACHGKVSICPGFNTIQMAGGFSGFSYVAENWSVRENWSVDLFYSSSKYTPEI